MLYEGGIREPLIVRWPGRLELYNLRDDIGEERDLAEERPDKVEELHADLVAWRRSVDAPVPTERNPEYRAG